MTQLYYKTSIGYRNLVLDTVYPVGSIYMSIDSTSPGTLFGGTWARITGQFLLAATDDGSSGASQAAGRTGGEATHTLTTAEMPKHTHGLNNHTHSYAKPNANTNGHTLTVKQIPSHTHSLGNAAAGSGVTYSDGWITTAYDKKNTLWSTESTGGGQSHSHGIGTTSTNTGGSSENTASTGSDGTHNNMPPYVAVYVWKRTA